MRVNPELNAYIREKAFPPREPDANEEAFRRFKADHPEWWKGAKRDSLRFKRILRRR